MHRLRDPQTLLLLAFVVLTVVPLWAIPYFPSQDGPAHLENAVILVSYNDPNFSLLRDFYTINTNFEPNWFGHLLLYALLTLFPPLIAEKILLSAYLLLFPLAAYYALEGIRPGNGWLATLALPFSRTLLFHLGFHNFSFSLAAWFLVVGYWWRHQGQWTFRNTGLLALLLVLLYFCHLVAVVLALLVIGTLGLIGAIADRKSGKIERGVTHPARRHLLLPLLAFGPTVLLALAFLGRQGVASEATLSLANLWDRLRQLEILVSYFPIEYLLSNSLFWALAGLGGLMLGSRLVTRKWDRSDGLLLVLVLALAAYFLAPSALAGGSFVNARIALFPFFVLILWLGTHSYRGAWRWLLQGAATLFCLAQLGLHTMAYAAFSEHMTEYLSVEAHLRPNTTLLPLTFQRKLQVGDGRLSGARVGVFRHTSGYLAARVGVLNLENYEAATGYFPVRFRPEVNPFVHLSPMGYGVDIGLQAEPPVIDLDAYYKKTGKNVDHVLTWHVLPEQRETPAGQAIFRQLDQSYDLVFTSKPHGLLQLYRRRGE